MPPIDSWKCTKPAVTNKHWPAMISSSIAVLFQSHLPYLFLDKTSSLQIVEPYTCKITAKHEKKLITKIGSSNFLGCMVSCQFL